ncbi:MAG: glycosyltransferase [Clostridiaceae bacterium]|nr:glycosyltransferase [Clostridiaceae bacterium]
MENKILFLRSGSCCYDSTIYFEQCISTELERLGWQTEHVSCPRDQAVSVLKTLYGRCYSVLFDINSVLPGLQDESGAFCMDQINGEVWHYILDHPLYHHDILKCPLKNFHVICLDEKHAEYIRKYYPHICQVICLPLAAKQAQRMIPYPERSQEVLFTGTYTDSDLVLCRAMQQPPEKTAVFRQAVQLLFDESDLTQEEALSRCTNSEDLPLFLQQNYLVDFFLRACLREELLAQFLKQKCPVTVYGHNWERFAEKCRKSIPYAEKYLRIRGEVSYERLPEIYADSKIALNQLPWFKAGMHDRIPLALMNGCVCVTDESTYLEQHFVADEELYFYSLGDMESVPGMVQELLNHPDEAVKTAARGYSCAAGHLGWKKWVEVFLGSRRDM